MVVFDGRAEVKEVEAGSALEFVLQIECGTRDEVIEFPDGAVIGEGHFWCELVGEMLKEVCSGTADEPFNAFDAAGVLDEEPELGGEVTGDFALGFAGLEVVPIGTQSWSRRRWWFWGMKFSVGSVSVEDFQGTMAVEEACDFAALAVCKRRTEEATGDAFEAKAEAHEADGALAGSIGEGDAVVVFDEASAARSSAVLGFRPQAAMIEGGEGKELFAQWAGFTCGQWRLARFQRGAVNVLGVAMDEALDNFFVAVKSGS